jgi:hypothetical protein
MACLLALLLAYLLPTLLQGPTVTIATNSTVLIRTVVLSHQLDMELE